MTDPPGLAGALVISLDFELRWGVRDHCPPGGPYERNLLRAREVIPRILELFEQYEIAATWATVGFLFARDRAELERYRPAVLPRYRDSRLDPYAERVGEDEASDPIHYAPSLVSRIAATPRQEIATHTFSHYYCGEPGAEPESFRADLDSAIAIAASRGIRLRSIVFPRNQHHAAYDECLLAAGITAYRGNPPSAMWRFADAQESGNRIRRAARLCDAYLPLTGDGSFAWGEVSRDSGLMDVRASFLLRPFIPRLAGFEELRFRRIRAALRQAARRGRILHLWWHPHNFGGHPEESLRLLRRILHEFALDRERYGMRSLGMSGIAEQVLQIRRGRNTAPHHRPPG